MIFILWAFNQCCKKWILFETVFQWILLSNPSFFIVGFLRRMYGGRGRQWEECQGGFLFLLGVLFLGNSWKMFPRKWHTGKPKRGGRAKERIIREIQRFKGRRRGWKWWRRGGKWMGPARGWVFSGGEEGVTLFWNKLGMVTESSWRIHSSFADWGREKHSEVFMAVYYPIFLFLAQTYTKQSEKDKVEALFYFDVS